MKFLSVFVLCIYVRTAYSLYTGSRSNPKPQNTTPHSPASYYQPAPYQQQYTMGPGLPIPGIQNKVQINPQANYYSGYSPYAMHHIEKNLKELYKTSVPNKRYTVVHPNGTIEHTDEIHSVKERYSNYHMVKAADIRAHFSQPNVYNRAPLPNQFNKPITTTNQNAEGNSYPDPKSIDVTTNLNVISSNPAGTGPGLSKEPNIKQNVEEVNKSIINASSTDIIQKEENYNPSITQDSHRNAVAANPLPVHTTQPVPDAVQNYVQPSESQVTNDNEATNNSTVTQGAAGAVAVSDSNSTDSSIIPTVPVQLPPKIEEREALEVILPQVHRQSTPQETQTATTIEETGPSQVIPEVTTIEEPIKPGNDNITNITNTSPSSELATVLSPNAVINVSQSKDRPDEITQLTDTSKTSTNSTTTTNIVQDPNNGPKDNSNPLQTSVSNQTKATFGNGEPFTWFKLSEESVWKSIRNNASNVYFFFLPPKPKRYKEIRITTFPNGTVVEQIIERDEDDSKNGKPQVIKNSTVVPKNVPENASKILNNTMDSLL